MNRVAKFLLLIIMLSGLAFGQSAPFKIKYISSTHVYLDGGRKEGLAVGDVLEIFRNGKKIGKIAVEYVAGYSASCVILEKSTSFRKGDRARLIKSAKKEGTETRNTEQKEKAPERKIPIYKPQLTRRPSERMRIQGYFSLQYYRFKDQGANGFDFSQPTARLRLKIRNFWQKGMNFELKFRSRYNQRVRRFSAEAPKTEWQNRIYQISLSYEPVGAPIHFKLGRVISNALSGVGYLDGALFQLNFKSNWQVGAFAGTQPDWRTSNWQTEIQKYGTYVGYQHGKYGANRSEFTLAAAGEYHGMTISREFLFFRGAYYHGRRWNIYQHVELDLNRAWRKKRAGQSVTLSGLYLSANYNITRDIGINLSYDNRKNYYTYELRTIADSLFDDAFRHGIRTSVYARFLDDYRLAVHFGVREKQTDSRFSFNYGLNLTKRRFFGNFNVFNVRIAGFDNIFANGINPNLQFSRRFRNGHYLSLNYGSYFYAIKNGGSNRLNNWVRVTGQMELPLRFYSSMNYEYNWGDDVKGYRVIVEIGYRF